MEMIKIGNEGIDLAPLLRALWKYKWFIAIVVIGATAIAGLLVWREKSLFVATADIRVGRIWNEPIEDVNILLEKINGQPFQARLAERMDRKRADALAISAERLEAGKGRARYVYLLRLSAKAARPEKAQEILDAAVAQVLEESDKKFADTYAVYQNRENELKAKIEAQKTAMAQTNIAPQELYSKRIELQLQEQELAEMSINNAPLKTFHTTRVEDNSPAKHIARSSTYRRIAMVAAGALAFAILAVLAFELRHTLTANRKESAN